ncbi:MAG TPA: hypothetical protein VEI95_00655 [Acidobacteriota bacterium]|nr:hypothetical protein [Acidobacteriota bacterium]
MVTDAIAAQTRLATIAIRASSWVGLLNRKKISYASCAAANLNHWLRETTRLCPRKRTISSFLYAQKFESGFVTVDKNFLTLYLKIAVKVPLALGSDR